MSNIQVYSNNNFCVRTTVDADGTVWFVGKDIAEALEYTESSLKQIGNLLSAVPEEWKGLKQINTPGGEQNMLCLTEQGLYFFLGRSDKPKALPYQKWIAGEVVPSIRKTGSYSIAKKSGIDENLMLAAKVVLESAGITGNQCALSLDKLFKRYEGISALQAMGVELKAPEQEQLLTPSEIGKQLGLTGRRVNEILAGLGWQHKINKSWEAIGDGVNYSVMLDVGKRHTDGVPVRQLKWKSGVIDAVKARL
ncbi:MAG: hypothetical protein IJ667_07065 [Synergistaceae bacterium]|nr:hypothetical protein [Synergistaceae bacterium]